jgi:hypothetical protein
MIQVYKEAFKVRATSLRARRVARLTRFLNWPTRAKKTPIYTRTRQINYYFRTHFSVKNRDYDSGIIKNDF